MDGVVNIYKDSGMTSFDVVAKVRKIYSTKKCGHLGTLDPMAEGILPILLGYATKFADYLSCVDKEYIAEFKLGEISKSFDNSSDTEKISNKEVSREEIENLIPLFIGTVSLKVPAFSAKKINGVRAYKLARKNIIEDAGKKEMDIHSIELLDYTYPYGIIKVHCGKGTYIRSIINTMGEYLQVGAVMSGLLRSANGIFKINNSYKLTDINKFLQENTLYQTIIPVYDILDWGRSIVKDNFIKQIKNGVSPNRDAFLSLPLENESNEFFIMDNYNNLLAVATRCENSSYPLKLKFVIN